jgi:hypothetical protein
VDGPAGVRQGAREEGTTTTKKKNVRKQTKTGWLAGWLTPLTHSLTHSLTYSPAVGVAAVVVLGRDDGHLGGAAVALRRVMTVRVEAELEEKISVHGHLNFHQSINCINQLID